MAGEPFARRARLRFPWLDHWGDAVSGGLIAATGVVVMALGI
jgi:hypothetical protein